MHARQWGFAAALVLMAAPVVAGQVAPPAGGVPTAPPAAVVEPPAESHDTRLLFSPTARSLRRGEGYVGLYEFLMPFVQVGITNRLSFGVGAPLVLVLQDTGFPLFLAPKYQFHKGARTSAAVGVMHVVFAGEDGRAGLAYAVTTTGTDDNAVTLGLGWAYARYHDTRYDYSPCFGAGIAAASACAVSYRTTETEGAPVLMVGGEYRMSRRLKLVTENYAFQHGGIVSLAVRVIGKRFSADLGFISPVSTDGVFPAPVINFVWAFGRPAIR